MVLASYGISGGSSERDLRAAAAQIARELELDGWALLTLTRLLADMSHLAYMASPASTPVAGAGAAEARQRRYRLVAHCLTCLITNNENPNYSDGRAGLMPPAEGEV